MKQSIIILSFLFFLVSLTNAQEGNDGFTPIHINKTITSVQPMTGIVYWRGSYTNTESISLEFSYMLYNQVVSDSGVYHWDKVENYLNDIASRHHQAVFRFRYTYVGKQTAVPDYIKNLPDYHETEGISEGQTTWFPDWTNKELKRFTLEFYSKFAAKYDNDPRLAFLETGFGLWAEYHIYDGPFILGVTFPDKDFQATFFRHMDSVFINTPFMVSIDAASLETQPHYTPFYDQPALLDIPFGLFDDSFMHDTFGQTGEYNTESWNFFGRDRYLEAPAGGEFSYYSTYDQHHVLDWPDGPYGHPFEYFANNFHITFMIGADQPKYQTAARIKQASMATGYQFKIVSFKSKVDSSVVVVKNVGVAPIYYDAYVVVDSIRSPVSLKYLEPGDTIVCPVSAGGTNPELTITSDRLVAGQTIGYLGTENFLGTTGTPLPKSKMFSVYPTFPMKGQPVFVVNKNPDRETVTLTIMDLAGNRLRTFFSDKKRFSISTSALTPGMYILKICNNTGFVQTQKMIIQK